MKEKCLFPVLEFSAKVRTNRERGKGCGEKGRGVVLAPKELFRFREGGSGGPRGGFFPERRSLISREKEGTLYQPVHGRG